jgi:hypothetical protein
MRAALLLLVLVMVTAGCADRFKARMQAQIAYLQGQNAALKSAPGISGVTVRGPVQNSFVPWVAGLTLAQAIATANYTGATEPAQIILTRNGESAALEADVLLQGTVIPLEPGDLIELR